MAAAQAQQRRRAEQLVAGLEARLQLLERAARRVRLRARRRRCGRGGGTAGSRARGAARAPRRGSARRRGAPRSAIGRASGWNVWTSTRPGRVAAAAAGELRDAAGTCAPRRGSRAAPSAGVGVDHGGELDAGEVVALGDHLRAEQHGAVGVGEARAAPRRARSGFAAVSASSRISSSSGNSRASSRSSRCVPGAEPRELGRAARRARRRRRLGVAAVVAAQPPSPWRTSATSQFGQRIVVAAGAAVQRRRDAAAVEQQDRLAAALGDAAQLARAAAPRAGSPPRGAGRRRAPAAARRRRGRRARAARAAPSSRAAASRCRRPRPRPRAPRASRRPCARRSAGRTPACTTASCSSSTHDQAEPAHRREDRRARADDDPRLAARDPLALVAPLGVGQRRVQDRDAVAEARAEAADGLRRERDLGHEHDRAEPALERRRARLEVDLGLARCRSRRRAGSAPPPRVERGDDPRRRAACCVASSSAARPRPASDCRSAGGACSLRRFGVRRRDERERARRRRAVVVGEPEREVDERRRQLARRRARSATASIPSGGARRRPRRRRRARCASPKRHLDDRALADVVRHLVGERARERRARSRADRPRRAGHPASLAAGVGTLRRPAASRMKSVAKPRTSPSSDAPGRRASSSASARHDVRAARSRRRGSSRRRARGRAIETRLARPRSGRRACRGRSGRRRSGREPRKPQLGRSASPASGATIPKPSVALCRPKPMIRTSARLSSSERRRLADREALGEVVQADPGRDEEREPAAPGDESPTKWRSCSNSAADAAPGPSERARRRRRFIQRVVVDEAHQPDDDAAPRAASASQSEAARRRPSSSALLDRLDRRRSSTSQSRKSRIPVAIALRNAFAARRSTLCSRPSGSPRKIVEAGDRAEQRGSARSTCRSTSAAVRAHLTSGRRLRVARAWRRDIRSTSTSRRSTSSPSRSASTGRTDAGSPTLASRVAEMLGVSRASAGEMLKRLEAEGLVERGEHKEAILTDDGPRARRAGRPQAPDHRAAAHRLHGLHGRRGARARRRARRHVHATTWSSGSTSGSAIPTAARTAGRSTPTFEQAENRELAPLVGRSSRATRATIVRLAEHDGELLHWFYDEGLVPGREIEVREAAAGRGPVHACG